MLLFIPVVLMLLTALALVILRFARPQFKYTWLLAAGGAGFALISVFFWQLHLSQTVALPAWQPESLFNFVPAWTGDGTSWTYALALAALATAVILTSVVRSENEVLQWAATLTLCALGILAAMAANPLTLVLTWSVIDLAELGIMLSSTEGEGLNQGVIIAFGVRLAGTVLVLWANAASIAVGTPLDFHSIPPRIGIDLLVAAGLRLGVLPLHLPYRKENVIRRGFGTAVRLVSAAASLVLLARIPSSDLKSVQTPYLLILAAITAIYAGWMWLRSSEEIIGRPFLVLGIASLAVANSLWGNPAGSTAWGAALILSGGILFLYSARERRSFWLPLLGVVSLSALPFSLTASSWMGNNHPSWLYIIPYVPAQVLIISGFVRHSFHPGETSLESPEKWIKVIYPAGLILMALIGILLGLWGWQGARTIGLWWLSLIVLALAGGLVYLTFKSFNRISIGAPSAEWIQIFPIAWLYNLVLSIFNILQRIASLITGSLEGEGGLLWSLLLLVLIISLISSRGP